MINKSYEQAHEIKDDADRIYQLIENLHPNIKGRDEVLFLMTKLIEDISALELKLRNDEIENNRGPYYN